MARAGSVSGWTQGYTSQYGRIQFKSTSTSTAQEEAISVILTARDYLSGTTVAGPVQKEAHKASSVSVWLDTERYAKRTTAVGQHYIFDSNGEPIGAYTSYEVGYMSIEEEPAEF